jgi:hypothetical protein
MSRRIAGREANRLLKLSLRQVERLKAHLSASLIEESVVAELLIPLSDRRMV